MCQQGIPGRHLRQDWGFKGFVTSDCGAVDDFFTPNGHHYSADKEAAAVAGIRTGTDTNCGSTYKALTDASNKASSKNPKIDVSLKRLFTARLNSGFSTRDTMNPYASVPFSEVTSPAHHALALEASRESIALLKNDAAALPLKPAIKTIAVIGPNAVALSAIEGNYNAVPRDPVFPLDGIAAEFKNAKVLYSQGSSYADGMTIARPAHIASHSRRFIRTRPARGVLRQRSTSTASPSSLAPTSRSTSIGIPQARSPALPARPLRRPLERHHQPHLSRASTTSRCASRTATPAPTMKGLLSLSMANPSPASLPTQAQSFAPATPPRFTMTFDDTKPHELRVEYIHNAKLFGAGITMEWSPKPGCLNRRPSPLQSRLTRSSPLSACLPNLKAKRCLSTSRAFQAAIAPTSSSPPRNSICWKRLRPPANR